MAIILLIRKEKGQFKDREWRSESVQKVHYLNEEFPPLQSLSVVDTSGFSGWKEIAGSK
jgi:hypothetical protein